MPDGARPGTAGRKPGPGREHARGLTPAEEGRASTAGGLEGGPDSPGAPDPQTPINPFSSFPSMFSAVNPFRFSQLIRSLW